MFLLGLFEFQLLISLLHVTIWERSENAIFKFHILSGSLLKPMSMFFVGWIQGQIKENGDW